ncbi:MAG TPA: RNA polymerase sigma factor [Polyangiales bacterium]|nr:RNA polymerase sigma factor [Polyangiales bacterium]
MPLPMAKRSSDHGFGPQRDPTPLLEPIDDPELIERLARGDAWAKEALYRKYVHTVFGLALRLLGQRADAEDVVQDTFTEALRDVQQVRDRGALRSWLLGVAVHQVHRRFRRRRLLRVLGLERNDEPALDALAGRAVSAEQRLELRLLAQVLASLPARERMAWSLRFVEGCSLDEAARYCDCSLATIKRRIASAQRAVARHVQVAEVADE